MLSLRCGVLGTPIRVLSGASSAFDALDCFVGRIFHAEAANVTCGVMRTVTRTLVLMVHAADGAIGKLELALGKLAEKSSTTQLTVAGSTRFRCIAAAGTDGIFFLFLLRRRNGLGRRDGLRRGGGHGFLRIVQAGIAAICVHRMRVAVVIITFPAKVAVAAGAAAVLSFADAELFEAAGALHVGVGVVFRTALLQPAAAAKAVFPAGVGRIAVAQAAVFAESVVGFEERIVRGLYAAGRAGGFNYKVRKFFGGG